MYVSLRSATIFLEDNVRARKTMAGVRFTKGAPHRAASSVRHRLLASSLPNRVAPHRTASHRRDLFCCCILAPFFASRQFRRWTGARMTRRTWWATPRSPRQSRRVVRLRPPALVRTSTVPGGRCAGPCSATIASSNALAHSLTSFSLLWRLDVGRGSGSTADARRHGEAQRNSRENAARAPDLLSSFAIRAWEYLHEPHGRRDDPTSRTRSLSSIGEASPPSETSLPSSPSSTSFIQTHRASENFPSSSRRPHLSDGSNLVPANEVSGRESTALIGRSPTLAPSRAGQSSSIRPNGASTEAPGMLVVSQHRSSNNAAAPRQAVHQAQQHGPRAIEGRAETELSPEELGNSQGPRPAAYSSRHRRQKPDMSKAEKKLVSAHGQTSSQAAVEGFLSSVRPPSNYAAAPGQSAPQAQQHGAHASQGRSDTEATPEELGSGPGFRPAVSAPGDPGLAHPTSQREQEVTMAMAEQERRSRSRTGRSSSTRRNEASTAAPASVGMSQRRSSINAAASRQATHQGRQGVPHATQGRSGTRPGDRENGPGARPTMSAPPDPRRGPPMLQQEVADLVATARATVLEGFRWGTSQIRRIGESRNASSVASTGLHPDQSANFSSEAPVSANRLRFYFARQRRSRLTSNPCYDVALPWLDRCVLQVQNQIKTLSQLKHQPTDRAAPVTSLQQEWRRCRAVCMRSGQRASFPGAHPLPRPRRATLLVESPTTPLSRKVSST